MHIDEVAEDVIAHDIDELRRDDEVIEDDAVPTIHQNRLQVVEVDEGGLDIIEKTTHHQIEQTEYSYFVTLLLADTT